MAYKIGIVDDHQIVRTILSQTIQARDGFEVAFEITSGKELLEKDLSEVNCIFLDIHIEEINGTMVVPKLKENYPAVKILIISSKMDGYTLRMMLKAGVDGYIIKDELSPARIIFDAIKDMENGKHFFSEEVVPEAMAILRNRYGDNGQDLMKISAQLWVVAYYLDKSQSYAQIADILNISKETVSSHIKRLVSALGLAGGRELRTELRKGIYFLPMQDAIRDKNLPEIED